MYVSESMHRLLCMSEHLPLSHGRSTARAVSLQARVILGLNAVSALVLGLALTLQHWRRNRNYHHLREDYRLVWAGLAHARPVLWDRHASPSHRGGGGQRE